MDPALNSMFTSLGTNYEIRNQCFFMILADASLPFSDLCSVLFRFRVVAFIETVAFRSIGIRCACAPVATRSWPTTVCVLFRFVCFLFLWRYRFFGVLCTMAVSFLCGAYIVRLPSG